MPSSTVPDTSVPATGWSGTSTWNSNSSNTRVDNSDQGWLDSGKGWGKSSEERPNSSQGWGESSKKEGDSIHTGWLDSGKGWGKSSEEWGHSVAPESESTAQNPYASDAASSSGSGWGDSSTWQRGWGDAAPSWSDTAPNTPPIQQATTAPTWTQAPASPPSIPQPINHLPEFKRFPTSYDLHALWGSSYSDYVPIKWTRTDHIKMLDINFERYYWDTIHSCDNPKESPYIKEAMNLVHLKRYAHPMIIARLEYYDKKFTPRNHSTHKPGPPPVPFESTAERDTKLCVYKMLRRYYRREITGQEFTSVLDGDADLIMLDP